MQLSESVISGGYSQASLSVLETRQIIVSNMQR